MKKTCYGSSKKERKMPGKREILKRNHLKI